MFIFDVETLGKESNAVILSMACIHFNPEDKPSYKELVDSAFFVKLNVRDQILRLKRGTTKSTIEWWKKQCLNVKLKSVTPSDQDVTAEEALELFKAYAKQFPDYDKVYIWARGNLDQLVLDSLEEQLEFEPTFSFSKWRDVRTAVDFLYDSDTGYCEVDYEGFDPSLHVTKHDPVQDCAYDAMMLIYGKTKSVDNQE